MKFMKIVGGLLLVAAMAACGGGGGSAGTTTGGSSSGGGGTAGGVNDGTGGSQSSSAGTISLTVRNAANVEATLIGGAEQGHAVATVTSPSGAPVPGIIVVFSQADAELVTFAPESGTALTDANGRASIDFKATDQTKTGAFTVVASVLLNGSQLTAVKSMQITGSTSTAEVPTSLLFMDASPPAIVIKGAGGAGRSESSTLRFKAVNASNTPIKGAVINFAVSSPNVTLNIPQATSDAEGVVVTTVTSGTTPTSVVVTATAAANAGATVPSSALSVSNGLTMAGGLEIVAEQYNIDGGLTGATTTISAFMRDANGNLVPDGTIASFTTDFGAVGSSSAGSCTSVNGTCSVQFRVQEPRGTGVATVTGTVSLPGNATPLADSIQINMSRSASARAYLDTDTATPGLQPAVATELVLNGVCKDTITLYAGDVNVRALAVGTAITAEGPSRGVTVTVDSGSPVEDSLDANFAPTSFRVTVDATNASPACVAAGALPGSPNASVELRFKSPNGISSIVPMGIRYPR